MTWHLAPLAAFDVESTGTDVETDRIVTATLVRIHGRQTETRSWLINPGVPPGRGDRSPRCHRRDGQPRSTGHGCSS